MLEVLLRFVMRLMEFVREVHHGIAVGYGFEPSETSKRRGWSGPRSVPSVACRRRKSGKKLRDNRHDHSS
jgi:hypothetical protein